jgi:response regulator NasT
MESALIISDSGKSRVFFTEMLNAASVTHIAAVQSGGEARRHLLEKDFELVLVDTPLRDESGENLSRYIISKSASQVVLFVKNECFDVVSAVCGDDGILTVSKPVNRAVFLAALSLAKAAGNRIRRIQAENAQLRRKIEDIRIVDRAKWILISYMKLSEQEAHRYMEKQAMDMRTTKRAIAEGILKTYDN